MTKLLVTTATTITDELTTPARSSALTEIDRRFDLRVYDHDTLDFATSDHAEVVQLSRGRLLVDGREVPNPRFGPSFVSFCATDGQIDLAGVLDFTADARALTGTLSVGPAGAAHPLQVAGVAPAATYDTRMGTTGAEPPSGQGFPAWSPPPPSAWRESLTLTQTYTFVPGQLPTPVFEIGGQDVTTYAATETDPKTGNLLVSIDIPPDVIDEYVDQLGADAPVGLAIEIAGLDLKLNGCARRAVRNTQGGYEASSELYAFEGTWDARASRAPHASSVTRVGGGAELTVAPAGGPLGITALFTMQVDQKQLQRDQFDALVHNMKWALGQDPNHRSLLDFFGELPPDLPDGAPDLVKKDVAFYTTQMATSYLASPINAMKGPGEPTTRLTEAQLRDVQFYLRAGLAKDPAFTRQTHGVFLTALTQAAEGLSDYIDDQARHTTNGKTDPAHDWAAQLFGELTKPQQLNLTYNNARSGYGMAGFNRHTALLMALDQSGTYAKRYHRAFLARSLGASIPHLSLGDKGATTAWLELAINAIIATCKANQQGLGVDPDTERRLRQLAEELDEAAARANGVAALAAALADLAIAADAGRFSGGDFWRGLRAAEAAWARAGYVFARAIYVVAIVAGLLGAVTSFLKWDKLTEPERGEAVVATIESAAKIIQTIKDIWSGEWGFVQSGQVENAVSMTDLTEPLLARVSDAQLADATSGLANLADGGGALDTTGTRWGELFTTFDGVMSLIASAAATALAVLSSVTFIEDILDHAPTLETAFDGVISAANFAVAIASVVAIFSASQAVPIIGAVCAAVGVIFAFIELFLPHPKPETPAEKFMKNDLLPAIVGPKPWILPSPAGWNPNLPIPKDNAYRHSG